MKKNQLTSKELRFAKPNPVDVYFRDNVLNAIYFTANKNLRPIILEKQFMDMANLIMEIQAGNIIPKEDLNHKEKTIG